MWRSQFRIRNLTLGNNLNNIIVLLHFSKDTKVRTKRWKIYEDSEIFRVEASWKDDRYTISSPMLIAMSHWLFDTITSENSSTQEEAIKWKQDRAKYGDLYLKNEYWLCFGKAEYAEVSLADQTWYIRYENSTISFPINVNVETSTTHSQA